jgi:hypothetical protein
MRNPVYLPQWAVVLTSVVVALTSFASGETFTAFFRVQPPGLADQPSAASGAPAFHGIFWNQLVIPISAGPTLLPTKQKSPNFTSRTVTLWFGFRTAESVPKGSR